MVSSGVVAAIHAAGVRCGPCGAMQRILPEDDLLGSKHVGVPLNIFLCILIKSAH